MFYFLYFLDFILEFGMCEFFCDLRMKLHLCGMGCFEFVLGSFECQNFSKKVPKMPHL